MHGTIWAFSLLDLAHFRGFLPSGTPLSFCCPCLVEDQAVHVKRQVGKRGLGFGAGQVDGADKQAHDRFLMREHMLDAGANLGFGGVAASDIPRHRPTLGLPTVDTADPALGPQPTLVALAAIGRIGPDVRGGVVARYHVAQHAPVEPRAIGRLALPDEAEGAANRHAALIAEARDGDVGLRPAIGGRSSLGELQCPADRRPPRAASYGPITRRAPIAVSSDPAARSQ